MKKYFLIILTIASLFTLSSIHGIQKKDIMDPEKAEKIQSLFSQEEEKAIKKLFEGEDEEAALKEFSQIIHENTSIMGIPTFYHKMIKYDQILRIIFSSKNKKTDCYNHIKIVVKEHLLACIYQKTKNNDDIEFNIYSESFSKNYSLISSHKKYAWYKKYITYLYSTFYYLKKDKNDETVEKQVSKAIEKALKEEQNVKLKEKFTSEFSEPMIILKKTYPNLSNFKDFIETTWQNIYTGGDDISGHYKFENTLSGRCTFEYTL